MSRNCYFSVRAPLNFYWGGAWYRYSPGEIFVEPEQRANNLLEAMTSEQRNRVGVTRDKESDKQIKLHDQNGGVNHGEVQSEYDAQSIESEQRRSEDSERPGKSNEHEENATQEKEHEKRQELEVELFGEEDPHWASVNKVLSDLLESDEPDQEKISWICETYSNYKAVRQTCDKHQVNTME
jgi:hypothetical protein